jgi:D-serine deaminase-like pyridoxal phosphate-dependent protein
MTTAPRTVEPVGEFPDLASGGLATPALLVDRSALDANIRGMAERVSAVGAWLWPHAKTHKSAEIARAQLAAGAQGITVATVAEAETMVAAGVDQILIAYPPVDEWRLERIMALAARARILITLDDIETLRRLDHACAQADVSLGYLWEIDCGNHRCGSPPGEPSAELVTAAVASARHVEFNGLMTFAGHAYSARDDAELRAIARQEITAVRSTATELARRGVESPILSIGSTPTAHCLDDRAAGMYVRPGNYVFNDATQVALGTASVDTCALTVLTTVISRPQPDRAIFDAGSKALSSDRMTARAGGFGIVCEMPGVAIERLYEEHAIARVDAGTRLDVGHALASHPHPCLHHGQPPRRRLHRRERFGRRHMVGGGARLDVSGAYQGGVAAPISTATPSSEALRNACGVSVRKRIASPWPSTYDSLPSSSSTSPNTTKANSSPAWAIGSLR